MLDNLAHANFTMTQMDARITDLVARLYAPSMLIASLAPVCADR
jgi:hypothetical protein